MGADYHATHGLKLGYHVENATKSKDWGIIELRTEAPYVSDSSREIRLYTNPSDIDAVDPGEDVIVSIEFVKATK